MSGLELLLLAWLLSLIVMPEPAAAPGAASEGLKPSEAAAPIVVEARLPPRRDAGPPDPPALLPESRACRDAPNYLTGDFERLPGQVDGTLVRGASGLRKLRRKWGNALIILRGGDFSGADLRGARLHNICFVGSKFIGSDWRNARAPGVGFFWSDLTGARLQGARMRNVLIDGPELAKVDATGADFSGGRLSGNAMGSWEGFGSTARI
jgi:hypothetical protein